MIKDKLLSAVIILSLVATGVTCYIAGNLKVLAEQPQPSAVEMVERATKVAETISVKSQGETGTDVSTVEIWDDGTVRIITMQGYINQLSDNTIVITNQSLDHVIKEIREAEDSTGGNENEF